MSPSTPSDRWKSEAEFFDREAEETLKQVSVIHPETVKRYGSLKRRRFNKEFRFRLMGDLAGKRVLDVGCGDGVNAITLAVLGAHVTGIDISPKAIEVAKRRAEVNNVEGQVTFICSPLELADLPEASFDIVWGDAILHHLIEDLDKVVGRMKRWVKPGGIIMFGEPVNLARPLRALRLKLPISTDATPDERPLEAPELSILRRHLPGLSTTSFDLLARWNRFVLGGWVYEGASPLRKGLANLLLALDAAILSLPGLRRLGATMVLYARVP